jgi:DNA-directed RNA polymerase sigma subunit (sigma70/sigma32)
MLLFLYESSRTVRIPTNKVQQLKAIKDIQSKLVVTTGRDISMEEAIEHLKASGDERFKNFDMLNLDFVLTADNKPHSLNSTLSSDGDSITWEDVIPSQIESPEAQVMKSSGFELLMDFLHVLNPVEKEIVLRHHGLNGQLNEETFESISADLGISSQSIQQKYKKSLKKLKIHARKSDIRRGDFNYQ